MGKYVSVQSIKKRLEGKVQFGDPGSTDQNQMTGDLLNSLILEGETQLEIDLMNRYELPLQRTDGQPFSALPTTTKTVLGTLGELICVIRILETDFGRGTSANSDKYTEKLQTRYDGLVAQLVAKRKNAGEETQAWKLPPLPGLKLAYNNQGDTGFMGRVMHTTELHGGDATYAAHQINSVGHDFFSWIDGETQ